MQVRIPTRAVNLLPSHLIVSRWWTQCLVLRMRHTQKAKKRQQRNSDTGEHTFYKKPYKTENVLSPRQISVKIPLTLKTELVTVQNGCMLLKRNALQLYAWRTKNNIENISRMGSATMLPLAFLQENHREFPMGKLTLGQ